MEDLDAVAERIGEHDKVLDPPLVGERARAARKLDAGLLQPCREVVERGRVRHLPAEESHALAAVLVHDHALLAVVHPQRQALAALVDELHAEKPGAEGGPVLEQLRANADIAETLNIHGRRPPWANARHPDLASRGRDERRQSCGEICASSTILAMSRSAVTGARESKRIGRGQRGVGSPLNYSGRPALRSPSATRCSCCWYCGLVSASGTGENRRNVDTRVLGRLSKYAASSARASSVRPSSA